MAGFEIRDSIGWVYGSGFPKSLDVSKAIDKQSGYQGEVVGTEVVDIGMQGGSMHAGRETKLAEREIKDLSPEAKQWQGWGTALKPALEPIVVARKPLIGTVAENVLTHGTGGLNIDASRIGSETVGWQGAGRNVSATTGASQGGEQGGYNYGDGEARPVQGRWPANLILDEYTAERLDEQSGQSGTSTTKTGQYDSRSGFGGGQINIRHPDSGGASRFFYVAKASKRDRNEGLEDLAEKGKVFNGKNPESAGMADGSVEDKFTTQPAKNFHPTVKPTELMRYLVKLITPPGGTVLDPFTGSGSTGKAAILEGFDFIGIELTEDYWPIIEGRLKHAQAKVAERIKETSDQEQEKLF
jgi:site-specific DNA-methyltransferase (adenine-specific)